MRFLAHLSLLLALAGCGAITPAEADAGPPAAAPAPPRRGAHPAGSSGLDAGATPNEADKGKGGGKGACENGAPACDPNDEQ
jgi:hypothetical protein